MAPPLHPFPAHELPSQIQITATGRLRKQAVNLEKCALKEMLQYNCQVENTAVASVGKSGNENDDKGTIVCRPVVRLFRLCADGLVVETTAVETAV